MKIKSKVITTLMLSVPLFTSAAVLSQDFDKNQQSIVQSITDSAEKNAFDKKVEEAKIANSNVKEGTDSVAIPDENLKNYIKDELGITADVITQDDMLKLKKVSLTNNLSDPSKGIEVKTLVGLEYATNIANIYIQNQTSLQDSDFDVFKDDKLLQVVTINNSNLSSLAPFGNKEYLVSADFDDNKITDISPLKTSGTKRALEKIEFSGNNVTDISVLKDFQKPTSLKILKMGNNNISDVSVLTELTGLTDLYLGNKDGKTNNNNITNIPNLSGLKLEWFNAQNTGLSNIEFLEGLDATNLKSLMLDNNEIVDASPISSIKNLGSQTEIELHHNLIEDASMLYGFGYKRIDLSYNNITNLKGIDNITGDTNEIKLSHNLITDISDFSKLSDEQKRALTKIELFNNDIEDVSALAGNYDELVYLKISNNNIRDISVFNNITAPKIKYLWIYGNAITDLSPLSELIKQGTVSMTSSYFGNQNIEFFVETAYDIEPITIKSLDGTEQIIKAEDFVLESELNEDGQELYSYEFNLPFATSDESRGVDKGAFTGKITYTVGEKIEPPADDSKNNTGMIIGIVIAILLLIILLIILILLLLKKIKVSENVEQSKGKATFTINRKADSDIAKDIKGRELRGTQGDKEIKLNYSIVSHESENIGISLTGISNDEPIKGLVFLADEKANNDLEAKYEKDLKDYETALAKWEEEKAKAKEAEKDFNEEKPSKPEKAKPGKDIKVSGTVITSLETDEPKEKPDKKQKSSKSQAGFTFE